jgi:small subunit ribosomal protein S9
MTNKVELKNTFTGKYYFGLGKRKRSVALVRLYEAKGKGQAFINDQKITDWADYHELVQKMTSPLESVGLKGKFNITVVVKGGGKNSQAEAIRHGIARALEEYDSNFRETLKPLGFLSRDSRVKERKKYGLKRARKAPQFSKR